MKQRSVPATTGATLRPSPLKSPLSPFSAATMETKSPLRFLQGKLSARAPASVGKSPAADGADVSAVAEMEAGMRMLYAANEGDLDEVREILDTGRVDVNFRDIDDRTALHVAACQGQCGVVEFLLGRGAEVDPKDRWGSTPLGDAIHYDNQGVIKILDKYGAKPPIIPIHDENAPEVPEYEIDSEEIDFLNGFTIRKGTFRLASWRGTQVAVKVLGDDLIIDEDKMWVGEYICRGNTC